MKAACGIDEKDVGPSGFCRLHRVIDDRRGIRALGGADNIDSRPLCPLGQLFIGSRAECVGARDQHSFALSAVIGREFPDRSRLPDAVDTDHKDHRRPLLEVVGILRLLHLVADPQDQLLAAVGAVPDPLVLHLLPEVVEKLLRRLDADVAHDHRLLELLQKFLAHLLIPVGIEDNIHIVGYVGLCLTQPFFQSCKKAQFFFCHRHLPFLSVFADSHDTSSSSSIRSTLTRAETPFSCIVMP